MAPPGDTRARARSKSDGRAAPESAIRPGRWNRRDQLGTKGINGSLGGDRVVLIPLDGLRDGQAQLAQPQPERPPRDPEDPGGLELAAPGRPQHQRQEESVELATRL